MTLFSGTGEGDLRERDRERGKKNGTFSYLIKPNWKVCLIANKEVACKEAHGWGAQAESRRDEKVTFMAPVHQTPPYRIGSLLWTAPSWPLARVTKLKGEPALAACRLIKMRQPN